MTEDRFCSQLRTGYSCSPMFVDEASLLREC
jgi:hypothetical protein